MDTNFYKVLARQYRPQRFEEVVGQDALVTTLKNAIKFQRVAHAYLFSGSRGTGKTTLARLFSKALNCQQLDSEGEPCNQCPSCQGIANGSSLDVLEIDGASNRGIDDIRRINETISYVPALGQYKIYLIDEVHMLTKEAFNALLKNLEEPPPKVKFFLATTEPHRIPSTVLSRCQRFQLQRIPSDKIVQKLSSIADDLKVKVQPAALKLVAETSEGSLRDAECLFDQILTFVEGEITQDAVTEALGLMPRHCFLELDRAGAEGNFAFAFDLAAQVFSKGKDVAHFVEDLTTHYRRLLLLKLGHPSDFLYSVEDEDKKRYETSAALYSLPQCLTLIDLLIEGAQQIKSAPSQQIALEALLLRLLRSHQKIPIDALVQRLIELERHFTAEPTISETKKEEIAPPAPVAETTHHPSRYDTLLRFAAIELEGTIKKG